MVTPFCLVHGTRVLLSYSDLEGIRNTPAGIEVAFRCWCGYRGTWLTGRAARSAVGRPSDAPAR